MTRSELSLQISIRTLKSYLFTLFLYDCETWTIDAGMETKIDAIEMYFYLRMLRIPWLQKGSNEKVLTRVGKLKKIMYIWVIYSEAQGAK